MPVVIAVECHEEAKREPKEMDAPLCNSYEVDEV